MQCRRVKRKCLKALYALSKDVSASKCTKLQELSKFAIPYSKWYKWSKRPNCYYFFSQLEQQIALKQYDVNKYKQHCCDTFEALTNFFKSQSYQNNTRYNEFLNNQNYWFWRQHFVCYDNEFDEKSSVDDNQSFWQRNVKIDGISDYSSSFDEDDDDDDVEDTDDDDSDSIEIDYSSEN